MKAGKLRHMVTLQQKGERTDDGTGGGSVPFVDVVDVWAAIEPLNGYELLRAEQIETAMTHRIRTRYYAGVRTSWRIRYVDQSLAKVQPDRPANERGVRVFDIKSVADIEERHRELELMCEELVTW